MHFWKLFFSYLGCCWVGWLCCSGPTRADDPNFQQGHYAQAIIYWTSKQATAQDTNTQLQAGLHLAVAYRYLGLYEQATTHLQATLSIARQAQQQAYQILLLTEWGQVQWLRKPKAPQQAKRYIHQALTLAYQYGNTRLLAYVLNQWGHSLQTEAYYSEALTAYAHALVNLFTPGEKLPTLGFWPLETLVLRNAILVNQAQATFLFEKNQAYRYTDKAYAFSASLAMIKQAPQRLLDSQPYTYDNILYLLTLERLAQKIQSLSSVQLQEAAYHLLKQAQKIAHYLDNTRAKAHVQGALGHLYEREKRYEEALKLTRAALFFANQNHELTLLYYWQWQLGRIFKAQRRYSQAVTAYQQAINDLALVREQVINQNYYQVANSFQTYVAAVYLELIDLLLQQATTAKTAQQQEILVEIREIIESFRVVELQNYFKNECFLKKNHENCTHLEDIADNNTVILYPITLPDRLALIFSIQGHYSQVAVPVGEAALREEVALFMTTLHQHTPLVIDNEKDDKAAFCDLPSWSIETHRVGEKAFLPPAKKLYHWLIAPVLKQLTSHNINTLIIVPDKALRAVPFGALHDGKHFLIHTYALAIAPNVCLDNPEKWKRNQPNILLGGLSESVQGFSPLPCAKYELHALQKLYKETFSPLLNDTFTVAKIHEALSQSTYPIIHIASHAQFRADLEDTFLLTYEGKLSLDKLEQLMRLPHSQQQPVELLTLSACETAVGNDQAALGLAGIALKAGVKSTLASLWRVDDEATPAVVLEFYRQLQDSTLSKAQALQAAIKNILTDPQLTPYHHPYYWAAFLLIGNWL